MYGNGLGVMQNHGEAVNWYRRAAEQGHVEAHYNLGITHLGITKNHDQAAKWFRRGAELGHAKTQYMLGLMYANGQGVIKDYLRAHIWWNIVALNGDQEGEKYRDMVQKTLSSAQLATAQQMTRDCLNSDYQNCP